MLLYLIHSTGYGQSAFAYPIAGAALLSLCLSLWVVWHERASPVSLSLMSATVAIAVYLGGFALMVGAPSARAAFFWGKIAYLGVPFIVPAFYQFSMDLLGLRRKRRYVVRATWLVGVIYCILAVGTDSLVSGVFRVGWGYITRITLWNLPFIVWSSILLVLALRDYLGAYRGADPIQKARIRLFAIPILIGSVAFVDYAPSFGLPVAPWGFVLLTIFMVAAAVAVSRYHLPDLTPAFAADQIVRTMADPLLVCDHNGVIAFANPAAGRLLGWPEEQLVGKRLHRLLGTDLARTLLAHPWPEPREVEVRARRSEPLALSISASRVEAKRGQQVGIVVVARDIRERKRAEREISRREERFRALIDNARDTITILDGAGRITYDSPAARDVLGYDPERWLGRVVFERVHPDDLDGILTAFHEILDRPGASMEVECRLRHVSGSYRTFECQATNLLEHPAVQGIVINGRDVTEQRQLSDQLQQAQKMEAIGRLAGGVAHDFNNILTAIQGNVALIREELPEDSPYRPELEEIQAGADRASRLTNQLLSFSRRQVVRVEHIRLNTLVEEMRSMLVRLIGETIHLETELAASPDVIRVDRSQLEQVVMNLVVNARDAVGGAGKIRLSTSNVEVTAASSSTAEFQPSPGSYVRLDVADDGHGMDPETRSRLFEPFFTTKEPGRGTGLGLSTVYGSVRQASGYIDVDSAVGRGTTISVYFPRREGEPRPEPEAAALAPTELEGGGAVVLVVEDEAPVRSLIARVLERRGYEVLQATEGQDALDLAERADTKIDLLIADLVMPGLTGREVADRLTERYPAMATILISGYTADEVVREGILSGERVFLPKPFTPDALVRKVVAVLDHSNRSSP